MKTTLFSLIYLGIISLLTAQNPIHHTRMDQSWFQPGKADFDQEIYVPVFARANNDTVGYNTIETFNYQGHALDTIMHPNQTSSIFRYEAVAKKLWGGFFVAGTFNSCGTKVLFARSIHQTSGVIDKTVLHNDSLFNGVKDVKFMFMHSCAIQTQNAVYIAEFSIDTIQRVFSGKGDVNQISVFYDKIIAATNSGLYSIDIYSHSVVKLKDGVHNLVVHDNHQRFYSKSLFKVYKWNHHFSLIDSLDLTTSSMNIGAPDFISIHDNDLYMLDGRKVHRYDSSFYQINTPTGISLRESDTHLSNFKVSQNRISYFGTKGHYYDPSDSQPYIFGILPKSNSNPSDLSAKM